MSLLDTIFKRRGRAGTPSQDATDVPTAAAAGLTAGDLKGLSPDRGSSNQPRAGSPAAADDAKSVASAANSRKSAAAASNAGAGRSKARAPPLSAEGHHSSGYAAQHLFLAPLPRRRMVVPEAIRERQALHERETAAGKVVAPHYYYSEDELRALTPVRAASTAHHQKRRPRQALDVDADSGDDTLHSTHNKEGDSDDDIDAVLEGVPPLQFAPMAVTVTAAELSAVRRLASFDEPVRTDAALPIEIPTEGFRLRWLHDPTRHPRPARPATLLTMRTDYLLPTEVGGGGGAPTDRCALIESPRSVLVLVRNGATPMDLQQRPGGDSLTAPHAAFAERLRQEELARLRAEYEAVCRVLPEETVDSFFSLLREATSARGANANATTRSASSMSVGNISSTATTAAAGGNGGGGGGAAAAQVIRPMLERDDDGIYRVAFHYEVSTAASAVVDRLDRTRANLRTLVSTEMAMAAERTAVLEAQQQRSLAAAQSHERQLAARAQQRQVAAAIKADSVRQRTALRCEAAERLRQEAEAKYDAKQQRLAATEARKAEEALGRRAVRRRQEEEKERRRVGALQAADAHHESQLALRRAIVEEKEEACASAMAAKSEALQTAKERRGANERQALARKAEADARRAAERDERQLEQTAREEAAEAQVARLRKGQETAAAVRSLATLQKAIFIMERQEDEEAKAAEGRAQMVRRREAAEERQQRLVTVLDERRRLRQRAREEVRVRKAHMMAQQARIDQFNNLMAADRMLEAAARTSAATRVREEMTKEARREREALLQWRQQTLQETRQAAEERERTATLALFNRANPSDAVIYAERNAIAAGLVPRKRRPLAASMGAQPTELIE